MKVGALALALSLPLCLGACTPMDAGFGDSVRTNLAAQTIDPDPAANGAEPAYSGQKGAAAVERYRTDRVKPPKGIRTTDGISGGASNSGGSGR
ncbi:hypothetical protein KK488_09940 [Sphingobium sp. H33]|uniref:Pilus assembly protein n=1 Tax=Sphingobium nicotianae TaxID=2782607 RepID=A0A9X1DC87_9SPHN|nr:hypothetical protein [Sphingobium nicotianae]